MSPLGNVCPYKRKDIISFPSLCEGVVGRREKLIIYQLEVSSWKEASLDLDPTVNRKTRNKVPLHAICSGVYAT